MVFLQKTIQDLVKLLGYHSDLIDGCGPSMIIEHILKHLNSSRSQLIVKIFDDDILRSFQGLIPFPPSAILPFVSHERYIVTDLGVGMTDR